MCQFLFPITRPTVCRAFPNSQCLLHHDGCLVSFSWTLGMMIHKFSCSKQQHVSRFVIDDVFSVSSQRQFGCFASLGPSHVIDVNRFGFPITATHFIQSWTNSVDGCIGCQFQMKIGFATRFRRQSDKFIIFPRFRVG